MAILLLLCAVWGLTQVAIKIGNTGLSPLFHAGLRSAISALLLWAWSAARGVLFVYTAPFVVALGAHVLVPGERLRARTVAGLACAFAGVAVAFADGLRLPTWRELAGDAMQLGAAVCWAAVTVAVKAQRGPPISPNKTLF